MNRQSSDEGIEVPEHPFHPLASDYPLMPEEELRLMADDMAENGFDARFPVVWHEGLILDGRNRWLAARMAGVDPDAVQLAPNVDPALFVRRANEHRRHLTQEWLQRRRQERIARVAKARQEGKSTRVIATEEGMSQSQIVEDLKVATEQGCSVDPKMTTGKDGKTRPAVRPKPPPSEPETKGSKEEGSLPALPATPSPPRYPHSDMLCAWMDRAGGQSAYIDTQMGGIVALLKEPDKWDWRRVRSYLLPMLEALIATAGQYLKEIRAHEAHQGQAGRSQGSD